MDRCRLCDCSDETVIPVSEDGKQFQHPHMMQCVRALGRALKDLRVELGRQEAVDVDYVEVEVK
jgi:hypothetical protein